MLDLAKLIKFEEFNPQSWHYENKSFQHPFNSIVFFRRYDPSYKLRVF